jgi:hypothetical protein
VFPQQFEPSGDWGVITRLVDPFFPALFDELKRKGLVVQCLKQWFFDAVTLEYPVFSAFAA